MNGVANLVRRMAGGGDREENEHIGIFRSGEAIEASRKGGDFLVADEGAIQARGASVGHEVLKGFVDGIVFVAGAWFVVALKKDGLGSFTQNNGPLGSLPGLNGAKGFRNQAGRRPKYFSNSGRISRAFTSPTTVTTMFAGT